MTEYDPARTTPSYKDPVYARIKIEDPSPMLIGTIANLVEAFRIRGDEIGQPIMSTMNYNEFLIWGRLSTEDLANLDSEAKRNSEKWELTRLQAEADKAEKTKQIADALGISVEDYIAAAGGAK